MKKHLLAIGIGVAAGLLMAVGMVSYANAADLERGSIFADAPVATSPKAGVSFYLGAHAGATIATTEVSAGAAPASLSLDGLGSKGAIGGVHAGFDYAFGNGAFVGLEGFYSFQNTEFNLSAGGASLLNVALGDTYGVHARAGMAMGRVRPYVLAGWRHTALDWSGVAITGAPPGTFPGSMTGLDLGGGIEIPLAKNVDLGLQGVWTKYQQEDIKTGGTPVHLDTTGLEVTSRLNFRF